MTGARGRPRAVIVVVVGDREVPFASIDPAIRCDLRLLDHILRLRLELGRRGWTTRLTQVDEDLRGLVELAGLGDVLGL